MKLACHLFRQVIIFREGRLASLVVENAVLFRQIAEELHAAVNGDGDAFELSDEGESLEVTRDIELVAQLVPFTLNRKDLLTAAIKAMERSAQRPECMENTICMLEEIKLFLRDAALDLPCQCEPDGFGVGSLFKAAGFSFREEDMSLSARLYEYMKLSRELLGRKLFVFINPRAFLADEELDSFLAACVSSDFRMLFVDCVAKGRLECEDRLLIDEDLCELAQEG